MSTTAAATTRWRSPARLPADVLDVQVVSLSRNFGKEAALLAGLDHARFGAVLFMDGDGQHPPTLVETLVGHWLDDGYDVVYTAKAHRESEPLLRRLSVRGFYALINWGARHKIPEDAGDFRLLSPRAAAALQADAGAQPLLQRPGELDRLPPDPRRLRAGGAQPWAQHLERVLADRPLDRGADLVLGRAAAAREPARSAARGAALIFGAQILIETVFFGQSVPGYPSVVVGLMVLGGVQLIMIGIMGEYIGKILSELKARPVYFVAEHSLKTADDADARQGSSRGSAGAFGGRVDARGGERVCRSDSGDGRAPRVHRRRARSGCAPTTTASRRRSIAAIRDLIGAAASTPPR